MSILSRFLIYTLDLDAVARALASPVLRDYDADELDRTATIHYIRTRYMRLVADYGLPAGACDEVADRALRYIVATAKVRPLNLPFSFFE